MLSTEADVLEDFSLISDEGQVCSLYDLSLEKGLVLYFYAKDDSPMCSLQSLEFEALYDNFKKLGFNVVGVSTDSYKSHAIFKKRYELSFTLLSDKDHLLVERYGLWAKKKMFGKEYYGIMRSTFLIVNNEIVKVWNVNSVRGHASVVLNAIKSF